MSARGEGWASGQGWTRRAKTKDCEVSGTGSIDGPHLTAGDWQQIGGLARSGARKIDSSVESRSLSFGHSKNLASKKAQPSEEPALPLHRFSQGTAPSFEPPRLPPSCQITPGKVAPTTLRFRLNIEQLNRCSARASTLTSHPPTRTPLS